METYCTTEFTEEDGVLFEKILEDIKEKALEDLIKQQNRAVTLANAKAKRRQTKITKYTGAYNITPDEFEYIEEMSNHRKKIMNHYFSRITEAREHKSTKPCIQVFYNGRLVYSYTGIAFADWTRDYSFIILKTGEFLKGIRSREGNYWDNIRKGPWDKGYIEPTLDLCTNGEVHISDWVEEVVRRSQSYLRKDQLSVYLVYPILRGIAKTQSFNTLEDIFVKYVMEEKRPEILDKTLQELIINNFQGDKEEGLGRFEFVQMVKPALDHYIKENMLELIKLNRKELVGGRVSIFNKTLQEVITSYYIEKQLKGEN